jgi:hypothetical protein
LQIATTEDYPLINFDDPIEEASLFVEERQAEPDVDSPPPSRVSGFICD